MRWTWLLVAIMLTVSLAGCSDKSADEQDDPAATDGARGQDALPPDAPADEQAAQETTEEGAMQMRGPGGYKSSSSQGGSASQGASQGGAPPANQPPASSPPPSTSDAPGAQDEGNDTQPEQPEGPSWDPYNVEGWTTTYGVEGQLAGYSYTATISNDTVRTYNVDARIRPVEDTVLRSVALDASALQSYLDAGGTATDPANASRILASAPVVEAASQVVPIDHVVQEVRQGEVISESVVTVWLPLEGDMPEGYWAVAAMYFNDGTHEGSWEYALGEQATKGHVMVPYMAGDAIEDYAALDVFLTLYGVRVFAQYPAEGQPLPLYEAELDAMGYLFPEPGEEAPEEEEEPSQSSPFMVKPQGLVLVLDNATGGALPFQAFQVEQSETVDGQQQSFRLILGIGNPMPQEIGLEVHHPMTGSWRIAVQLESLLGAAGQVPPLPALPGLPGVGGEVPSL